MNNPTDAGTTQDASRDDQRSKRSAAYEEMKRVLNRQATVLSELRNRASIVLTANTVATTLFAMSVLPKKSHLLALEILALAAFALGIGACIAILWAVHDEGEIHDPHDWPSFARWPSKRRPCRWRVTFSIKEVIDFLEATDNDSWEQMVHEKFEFARATNHKTIDRRTSFLEWASVLLAVEILLWAWLALA